MSNKHEFDWDQQESEQPVPPPTPRPDHPSIGEVFLDWIERLVRWVLVLSLVMVSLTVLYVVYLALARMVDLVSHALWGGPWR